jgi:hypothetical protein
MSAPAGVGSLEPTVETDPTFVVFRWAARELGLPPPP